MADLRRHLKQILGLDRRQRVVILGAGNLGFALADYPGFRHGGFEIVSHLRRREGQGGTAFPVPASRCGTSGNCRSSSRASTSTSVWSPSPTTRRSDVVDLLAGNGIRAILNFAPGTLTVPDGVKIKNVDLSVSLESLSFFLAQGAHVEAAG